MYLTKELQFHDLQEKLERSGLTQHRPDLARLILSGQTSFQDAGDPEACALAGSVAARRDDEPTLPAPTRAAPTPYAAPPVPRDPADDDASADLARAAGGDVALPLARSLSLAPTFDPSGELAARALHDDDASPDLDHLFPEPPHAA